MNHRDGTPSTLLIVLFLGAALVTGCTAGSPADAGPTASAGPTDPTSGSPPSPVDPSGDTDELDGPIPSSGTEGPSLPPAGGAASPGETAAAGVQVGDTGSPCPLPVTLTAARDWEVTDVTDLQLVLHGLVPLCELHGRHAGVFGSIRVNSPADPGLGAAAALDAYAAEEVEGRPEIAEVLVDGRPAVEMSLSRAGEWNRTERALAVETEEGTIVITLTGLDQADFESSLPAYRLALNTLRVTGRPG
ncbi:hypothetical protein FHR81_000389 [Actinoalloteichus hoggarensis]|uniref:Uncharacterized protein n=1 Tax=Actinoalloteichus hoggarensis TaxID=1470176 RepID=A0A221W286_9PSEU|nr:lipoprotein [Actinoalloteichus hoggarensis]ASO19930.1 hypothetical protein AHOG_11435 [Actinoalloteichus hoggarensis]MBB5919360.1 hypothetical protein [Actinoalloteichus hoggarensis]